VFDRPLVEVAIPFADFFSFFELNKPKSGIGRPEQDFLSSQVSKRECSVPQPAVEEVKRERRSEYLGQV
jgi:hypothetical protein